MDPFSIGLLIMFVALVGIYLLDRPGWNATGKRLSRIVRANIEASKPVKSIEAKSTKALEQKTKDTWTAEFSGKPVDTDKKHEIVKTWYARVNGTIYPHFKCKCGYSDWHVSVSMASSKSKEHVRQQNAAEELLARNGGTHAW